jgi:hypothetical protein
LSLLDDLIDVLRNELYSASISWDIPLRLAVSLLDLRVPGTGCWMKGDDVSIQTTGAAETLPQQHLAQSEHVRDMITIAQYLYAARKTGLILRTASRRPICQP